MNSWVWAYSSTSACIPCWYREGEKNFILKGKDKIYIFAFDLSRRGSKDVTCFGGSDGEYRFEGFDQEPKSIRWMDNQEELVFSRDETGLTVNLTGYDYGRDYCVRVAVGELK